MWLIVLISSRLRLPVLILAQELLGLPKVCTTIDANGKVSNATPGVFFYYSFVTVPTGAFTIDVKQTNDLKLNKLFTIQGYSHNTSQIRLYH